MMKEKKGFRIDPGRPAAVASVFAFALTIPAQIMGYINSLNDPFITLALVFLPVLSASLMIAVILRIGRNALWFSIIPVCIGVLSFVFKLMIDPRETGLLHHVAAVILYLAIIALWALTVLYVIRTKWVLTVLFLIPFLKHILVNDLPILLGAVPAVPVSTWMKEFSMLFFMLALSLCATSFDTSDS